MSDADRKLLWGRAGGCCSLCKTLLTLDADDADASTPVVLGVEAHIVGRRPGSARFREMASDAADGYGNRILICPNDHVVIDRRPEVYSEEALRDAKRQHETWVAQRIRSIPQIRITDEHPGQQIVAHRVLTGRQLMRVLGVSLSSNTNHPDPRTRAEADLLGDFVQDIHDWSEIWREIGPGEQIKVEYDISERLDQFHLAGFVLYVGTRPRVLRGGGERTPWQEALIIIYRADDPAVKADPVGAAA